MDDHAKKTTVPLPDTLSQRIGVLARREVEARILAPLIDALGERFGRDAVLEVVRETIVKIAREQGCELAQTMGGNGSREFREAGKFWKKDNALEVDYLAQDEQVLDYNVTRCRYAEMYKALETPDLGYLLSCNRDFALLEGYNPGAVLRRTQTIMEGASYCDFRIAFPADRAAKDSDDG